MQRSTIVYILLMLLTLFSWWVAKQGWSGLYLAWGILGIALLKGQLIGDYFMGLKWVHSWWRWVILIWLTLVGSGIALAFRLAYA